VGVFDGLVFKNKMTKVIILGEAPGAEPEKKKIEFEKELGCDLCIYNTAAIPSSFSFIELVSLNYNDGIKDDFDLMFAHNGDRSKGMLVIGKFNDGIV
jgi:hypothetical protein